MIPIIEGGDVRLKIDLKRGKFPFVKSIRPSLKSCLQLPTQVFKEWVGRSGVFFFFFFFKEWSGGLVS